MDGTLSINPTVQYCTATLGIFIRDGTVQLVVMCKTFEPAPPTTLIVDTVTFCLEFLMVGRVTGTFACRKSSHYL